MADNENNEQREEGAARTLLATYTQLVAATAGEIERGRKGEWLTETVDGMSESQAKSLLKARIAAEALAGIEYVRAQDDQAAAELEELDASMF